MRQELVGLLIINLLKHFIIMCNSFGENANRKYAGLNIEHNIKFCHLYAISVQCHYFGPLVTRLLVKYTHFGMLS